VAEKDIVQSSEDLKLILFEGLPPTGLSVYREEEFFGEVRVKIIGESHLVTVGSFSELLSCKGSIACGSDSILSVNHHFSIEKVHFGDRKYMGTWKRILADGGAWIFYDFDMGDEFFELIINHAVTWLSIKEVMNGYSWKSVHVYPNEELGVFTKTTLTKKITEREEN